MAEQPEHHQAVTPQTWTRLDAAPDVEIYHDGIGSILVTSRRADPTIPTRESVNRGEHSINQYRAHHGITDEYPAALFGGQAAPVEFTTDENGAPVPQWPTNG